MFTFDNNYKVGVDIFLHENIEDTNSNGFVDIGSGMNAIKEAIAGNIVGETYIYDNYLDGEPGNGGSLYGAVVERMEKAQKEPTPEERRKYMIGLVPIIDWAKFNSIPGNKKNSSSNWKLPIKYFAYYEILDVIKQNTYVGSPEALNPLNQYLRKGEPPFNYKGKLPSNLLKNKGDDVESVTIVGRFTGEKVDARTIAEAGDQINPNPGGDTPATYSKLIK